MSTRTRALALLVGLTMTTAFVGCAEYEKDDASTTTEASGDAGDLPSRDEFIAEVRSSQGDAFASSLEGTGITIEDADPLYTEFIGCTYDEIKGEPEVVEELITTEGPISDDLNDRLEELAASCQDTFNAELRELLAAVPTTVAP